jgi:alanine racemase
VSFQSRAWLQLDASALINNIDCVRRHSDAEIVAVVKANAYGHGLAFVCQTLVPHVDAFAVAALDEALELRKLYPEKPIILLSGFYDAAQIEIFVSYNIRPVVFNLTQVDWLEASGARNMVLGLKIDTGMGRLGLALGEISAAISRLQRLGAEITLMSHFACADTPDAAQNERQHRDFKQATEGSGMKRSFVNSAALLTRPQDHYDQLRPGIMLYGSSPFQGRSAASLGLKPVSRLYATVLDVKRLNCGDSVGYSATWTATEPCTIGLVSIGYGDGYPRVVSSEAQLAIAGKRYSLVGRVSMDSLAFKLDQNGVVSIGERVELWGDTISADEVASWAGTIAYELFCKLTSRLDRQYG